MSHDQPQEQQHAGSDPEQEQQPASNVPHRSIPTSQYGPPPGAHTQYMPQPPGFGYPPYPPGHPPFAAPVYPPPFIYSPPKQRGAGFWVGISLGIVGGVFLMVICGCAALFFIGASAGSNARTSLSSTETASAESANVSSTPTIVSVGQDITVQGVSCSLTSVKVIQGDGKIRPKQGMQFIVVHVKLENNGGQEQDYSAANFHVQDSSGNITGSELFIPDTYTGNSLLTDGSLSAGGKTEGDLVFQVPTNDHGAQMVWDGPDPSSSIIYAWKLGL